MTAYVFVDCKRVLFESWQKSYMKYLTKLSNRPKLNMFAPIPCPHKFNVRLTMYAVQMNSENQIMVFYLEFPDNI